MKDSSAAGSRLPIPPNYQASKFLKGTSELVSSYYGTNKAKSSLTTKPFSIPAMNRS
jgi:hypothetical protein